MIKYILFDLDGTLMDFHKGEARSVQNAVKDVSGYTLKDEEIKKFQDINERLFNDFAFGRIKERITFQERRFEELFELLNIKADNKLANQKYIEYLKYASDLYEDVTEVLEYLKGKYRMFIASNGMTRVQKKRLENAGIDSYFEKSYISEECGANKPDKAFFDYILKDLNDLDGSHYIIIGDRSNTDIKGGKTVNMLGIYVNRDNVKDEYHADYEIQELRELKNIL